MRALKFLTGHMIYNLAYTLILQTTTTSTGAWYTVHNSTVSHNVATRFKWMMRKRNECQYF